MTSAGRRGPRVRWGQNFLVDRNIAEHIVAWADIDGRRVVEIGPGRGALTEMLAARAESLALVEIDPDLVALWRERLGNDPNVCVHQLDALELQLARVATVPVTVVSNLPYETGTAIVRRLLAKPADLRSAVVMLQKEVCERLLARPGSKSYGVLALHTQLVADVEAGRIVGAGCFRPQPKVSSQLVRLTPLASGWRHDVGSLATFEKLVAAAFTQRRKMLRNSIGRCLDDELGEGAADALFAAVGVRADQRPETVDLETFAALSRLIHRERETRA